MHHNRKPIIRGTMLVLVLAALWAEASPGPAPVLGCPAGTGQVGRAFSSTPVVTGGVPPFVFSVGAGALPPGLTLNPLSGAIIGTPSTQGTFNFSLRVADAEGHIGVSSCTQACSNASVSWNFSLPVGVLGASQAYVMNGIVITAYGFRNDGSATALFGNLTGSSQTGLGIAGNNNDIDSSSFVQLDLSNVTNSGAHNAQIVLNSLRGNGNFSLFGSNTLGAMGTLLASGSANGSAVAIPAFPSFRFVSVQATRAGLLVSALVFTLGNCTIPIGASTTPPATSAPPDLAIAMSHVGTFVGTSEGVFTIMVSNIGGTDTRGTITVAARLAGGLAPIAIEGRGWFCSLATMVCTRDDVLFAGGSLPPIFVSAGVSAGAPANFSGMLVSSATVAGSGEANLANNFAADTVVLGSAQTGANLVISKSHFGDFHQGDQGVSFTLLVSNNGSAATRHHGRRLELHFSQSGHALGMHASRFPGAWRQFPTCYRAGQCGRERAGLPKGRGHPGLPVG